MGWIRKTALIVLLTILVGGLTYLIQKEYGEYVYLKEHTVISILNDEEMPDLSIMMLNADFQLKEQKDQRVKEDKPQLEREVKAWNVRRGDLHLGQLSYEGMRLKTTGDYYYFLRYEPMASYDQPIQLQASIASTANQVTERHLIYPPVPEPLSPYSIGNSTWTEPTLLANEGGLPKHSLYFDGEDFSFHANMVNIYEPLGNGVRKEHYEDASPFYYKSTETAKQLTIPLPHLEGKQVEQWGVVGREGMFKWEDEGQRELMTRANLDRVRKWTPGGVQYIPDPSYVPYEDWSFWVVPAQHVGSKFLLYGDDRFSENFAIMSLEGALHTQNEQGFWYTEPKSSWLEQDYGISEGFYDTRFSTDAAWFLLDGYRKFGDLAYLEAAERYAAFFLEFAETHHDRTRSGGYLVYDYRQGQFDGQILKTHVSLNHLVAEMNFLYELYLDTKQEAYAEMAEKLHTAVIDTTERWVKPEDGDLWYAYMPDGSYGMKDYMHLTLKDLRYSQELFKRLNKNPDPQFQYLIDVKERYLTKMGHPLYDWEDLMFRLKDR
ncbi:hypothetical protein [Ammoniphilus sp. CFH 90114]|uniref:hypothetical protein n=1 Tax=Ammoniphilus sp. CFH 90114 TaxID=2493665 RepID=UPI00100FB63E|nr:hypothetical protein [Ammoniphilus sp. CFH 90114]RXT03690.1 hypothetical protein EIZ39_23475 [Ammoniphilus sp. CFH 90114]